MSKAKPKSADEIRRKVAQMMVDAVAQGTPPWRKPWSSSTNSGSPCNFHSRRKYTGINPLILMWTSMIYGYGSKHWGSDEAWLKQVGIHVKPDEYPTYITFFRMLPKRDPKTGKPIKVKGKDVYIPMLREFPVYNIEQLQAPSVATLVSSNTRAKLLKLAETHLPANGQPCPTWQKQKIAEVVHDGIKQRMIRYLAIPQDQNYEPDFHPAEDFIRATGAEVNYAGDRAFYSKADDAITVPHKRKFETMADFYETVFHELIHWTEKEGRVGVKVFAADNDWLSKYAFNELVAEIGACLLLIELGVPLADKMVEKSAGYVKHWLMGMKNDPKFIFDAAKQAGKAVDFLMNPVEGATISEEHNREAERAVA